MVRSLAWNRVPLNRDGYQLTGNKSGSQTSPCGLMSCDLGQVCLWATTMVAIRAFILVKRHGGLSGLKIHGKGACARVTGEIVMEGRRVGEEQDATPRQRLKGPLTCLRYRAPYADRMGSLGAAESLLALTASSIHLDRHNSVRLSHRKLIQKKLADMQTEITWVCKVAALGPMKRRKGTAAV